MFGQMKSKPDPVDSKTFKFREQEGSCRNLTITHLHSGQVIHVERADIPELIEGLKTAYGI